MSLFDVDEPDAAGPAPAVELDDRARDLFYEWQNAKAAIEQWTDRAADLAAELFGRIPGDRATATIDGHVVVTKVPEGETRKFDSARFRREQHDLWAEYQKTTPRSGYLRLIAKAAQ